MSYYQETQAVAWELVQGHMNNGIISNQKIAKYKSVAETNRTLQLGTLWRVCTYIKLC